MSTISNRLFHRSEFECPLSEDSQNQLNDLLSSWKEIARSTDNRNYDLDFLISYDDKKKETIKQWLKNLSRIAEFYFNPQELAHTVCAILESLQHFGEFRELFFIQVEINNKQKSCADRVAMALNELYTCWKLYTIDKNSPLKEKLTILGSIARTNALRASLAKMMVSLERSQSTSIYLINEIKLKDELHLTSAIHKMMYPWPGQRSSVDLDLLKKSVLERYKTHMFQTFAFQKLINLDETFVCQKKELEDKFVSKAVRLFTVFLDNVLSDEEYTSSMKVLELDKQKAIENLFDDWVEKKLQE